MHEMRVFLPFCPPYATREVCLLCIIQNVFHHLEPSGHYMYHQLENSDILRSTHNAFMWFAWISQQMEIISLLNIKTSDLKPRKRAFIARYELRFHSR